MSFIKNASSTALLLAGGGTDSSTYMNKSMRRDHVHITTSATLNGKAIEDPDLYITVIDGYCVGVYIVGYIKSSCFSDNKYMKKSSAAVIPEKYRPYGTITLISESIYSGNQNTARQLYIDNGGYMYSYGTAGTNTGTNGPYYHTSSSLEYGAYWFVKPFKV